MQFIYWLHVPWPGIEPATLVYQDDALTELPGQGSALLLNTFRSWPHPTLCTQAETSVLSCTIANRLPNGLQGQLLPTTIYFLQSSHRDHFKYKLHCITPLLKSLNVSSSHYLKKKINFLKCPWKVLHGLSTPKPSYHHITLISIFSPSTLPLTHPTVLTQVSLRSFSGLWNCYFVYFGTQFT